MTDQHLLYHASAKCLFALLLSGTICKCCYVLPQVRLLPPVSAYVERLAALPAFKAGTEACLCGEPLQAFADAFAQSLAGGLSAHPKLPIPGIATSPAHCALACSVACWALHLPLVCMQVLSCTGLKSLLSIPDAGEWNLFHSQVSLEVSFPNQITMHALMLTCPDLLPFFLRLLLAPCCCVGCFSKLTT